jgi:hypothetical protein
LKIIKSFKGLELVHIHGDAYCVRRKVSGWLYKGYRYANLDIRGTDLFVSDNLISGITVDSLKRCEYIYNCNAIKLGTLDVQD